MLGIQGYEPTVVDDTVVLANCPFDALAQKHTDLVCSLNRSFVQGVADGLGCRDVVASLEPQPETCCVPGPRHRLTRGCGSTSSRPGAGSACTPLD